MIAKKLLKIHYFLLLAFIFVSCGLDPKFNSSSISSPIEPLKVEGCMNSFAANFSKDAEIENGSCQFKGCLLFNPDLKREVENYQNKFPSAIHQDTCPARVNEELKQEKKPHVGILWVMDNSYSMEDEQKNLGNNFNSFISQFINKDLDFTMGITTTDSDHITTSLKLLTSDAARSNRGKFVQDFKKLINVGVNGSSNEKGYEGAMNFLDKYGNDLLKVDSHLVVIFVSDEPDQSKNNAQYYLDDLYSYVTYPEKVRTHGILDLDNSSGDDYTLGEKYLYSVKKTGGVSGDISNNFAKILSDIGDHLVPLQSIFNLKEIPYIPSLTVQINGTAISTWEYLPIDNAIKVTPAPDFNAIIKISYIPKI